MTAAKLLTSDTMISDRDVLRFDWEGSPRFYYVRIIPRDPVECPSHPHLYTPRVMVHVELEGDPSAYFDCFCDDEADEINEAVFDCIHEIEDLKIEEWDAEQDRNRRQMEADYWRSRL